MSAVSLSLQSPIASNPAAKGQNGDQAGNRNDGEHAKFMSVIRSMADEEQKIGSKPPPHASPLTSGQGDIDPGFAKARSSLESLLSGAAQTKSGANPDKDYPKTEKEKRIVNSGADAEGLFPPGMIGAPIPGGVSPVGVMQVGTTSIPGVSATGAREASAQSPVKHDEKSSEPEATMEPTSDVRVVESRTYLGLDRGRTRLGAGVQSALEGRDPVAGGPSSNVASSKALAPPVQASAEPSKSGHSHHGEDKNASAREPQSADQIGHSSEPQTVVALDPQNSTNASMATIPPVSSTLGDLQKLISGAASTLVTQSQNVPIATNGPKVSDAVKELSVALDPAELGTISVKLQLRNGNLHLAIEVENANTLKAIESQKAEISKKLGLSDEAPISLVIRSPDQSPIQLASGSNDGGSGGRTGGADHPAHGSGGGGSSEMFSGQRESSGRESGEESHYGGKFNESGLSRRVASDGVFV